MSDARQIRASDDDREQAARALREHYAAGRLTEEELAERVDRVYRATTTEELEHLRRDLPSPPASPGAGRAELRRRQGELRAQLLQHAGGAMAPFLICTLVWAATGANGAFWPVWLLIFPVVFVARSAWSIYGPAPQLDRVQAELERRGRRRAAGTRHS